MLNYVLDCVYEIETFIDLYSITMFPVVSGLWYRSSCSRPAHYCTDCRQ